MERSTPTTTLSTKSANPTAASSVYGNAVYEGKQSCAPGSTGPTVGTIGNHCNIEFADTVNADDDAHSRTELIEESTHEATNGNNAVKSDWDEPSSGNTESSTGDAFLQYQGHVEDSPRAGMPAGASPGDVHDSEEMQACDCVQPEVAHQSAQGQESSKDSYPRAMSGFPHKVTASEDSGRSTMTNVEEDSERQEDSSIASGAEAAYETNVESENEAESELESQPEVECVAEGMAGVITEEAGEMQTASAASEAVAMPASLEAQLEAAITDKEHAEAQLEKKETERMSLQASLADFEGQAAYGYFMRKPMLKVEGLYPDSLPLTTPTLISTDQDQQARQKFIKATGGPKTGKWAMQHPDFSNVVRILAGSEHGVGVLGSGISGDVLYGEILMADDSIVPCALKRIAYGNEQQQYNANAELAALRDAEGCPHLVQCYAAWDHCCPTTHHRVLWIAMRYVEGVEYPEVYRQLCTLFADNHPEAMDRWYASGKKLLQDICTALRWFHERGRAHCDLSTRNMRIQPGIEPGTISHVTLVDYGGNINFKGQNGCRPPNMTCNMDTASLEFSSFDPERHLDGCAHDMWGFGTMIMMMFGRVANWKVPRTLDRQGDYLKLHAHH